MSLTVDSDSNTLVEHISVAANESRYLAQLVNLQVFRGDALRRLGLDNIDLKVVRFRNGVDRD